MLKLIFFTIEFVNIVKLDLDFDGFKKAFLELIYKLTKSSDYKKIEIFNINEVKSMIEAFSIQEEKFVNKIYYVTLGVSFNKKKIRPANYH